MNTSDAQKYPLEGGGVETRNRESLHVTVSEGVVRTVAAAPSRSVMEAIRDAGISELPAYCGGCCSCATCHVYVGSEWLNQLPPMSNDEDALLDSISNRQANSRLSCQIPFASRLHGMDVTVAVDE